MIEEGLADRDTGLHKAHIKGLADLAASVLSCRSANTGEWISVLPGSKVDAKSKERFISRLLSNCLIRPNYVMRGFIPEILEMMSSNDQVIIFQPDQSKISDGFECLMVSAGIGNRALPVTWKVIATEGAIV